MNNSRQIQINYQTPENRNNTLLLEPNLIGSNDGVNFIFKLEKPKGFTFSVQKFNDDNLLTSEQNGVKNEIALRIAELEQMKIFLKFFKIQSTNKQLNLVLIDSYLPELLAYVVYYSYKCGRSKMTDLLNLLIINNPLEFNMSHGHEFYKIKLANFLNETALGMMSEKVWKGTNYTSNAVISSKQMEGFTSKTYSEREFLDYLLNNTKLEQTATGEDETNPDHAKLKSKPYKYGWVYEENGELFVKLNLQIRFC